MNDLGPAHSPDKRKVLFLRNHGFNTLPIIGVDQWQVRLSKLDKSPGLLVLPLPTQ